MAGSKTGTWTIVQAAEKITDMYTTYGAIDLEARTNTAFYDCIVALVTCYQALQNTDDYLLQKDRTGLSGPEDPI